MILVWLKLTYWQRSEWHTVIGMVFDIMTNYQSIHDLKKRTVHWLGMGFWKEHSHLQYL